MVPGSPRRRIRPGGFGANVKVVPYRCRVAHSGLLQTLIPSETDACDDCCRRAFHRSCSRPHLDGPPDRSCGPDRGGDLQHHGVPDAAALQGPGGAARVRCAACCRARAGGHCPRQRPVPLRLYAVRRPPGHARPLRGRRGTDPAARSGRGTRLDARGGLRGVRPADPQRPHPGPCRPAPTREPEAGRAGACAPTARVRAAGYSRWLLLTHRSTRRGRDAATPPSTPHVTRGTPRPAPRTGTGALKERGRTAALPSRRGVGHRKPHLACRVDVRAPPRHNRPLSGHPADT